jgi:hypothetical protein
VGVLLQCKSDFCGKQSRDMKAFLNHVKYHLGISGPTSCPYKDYSAKFHNVSTYTSHLGRKHRNEYYDMRGSNQTVSEAENEPYEVADLPGTSVEASCGNVGTEEICQVRSIATAERAEFCIVSSQIAEQEFASRTKSPRSC